MEKRNPTQHRMTRRSAAHDYSRPGIYHITLHVAEALGQPLGVIVGSADAPDGSADAPHMVLSSIGQMVEHELLTAIHTHYSMVTVQDYIIMPEHLHFLMIVSDRIVSKNGKHLSLGQVIAGFKKGCNRSYWEMTGQPQGMASGVVSASPAVSDGGAQSASSGGGGTTAHTVPGGFPAGYKVYSSATTGHQPLFAPGYCDVMPIDAAQLATQRAYIAGNPRSRLLRMSHRDWLLPRRQTIVSALTPSALRGYLQRECPPALATTDALAAIEARLLLALSVPAAAPSVPAAAPSVPAAAPSVPSAVPAAPSVASPAVPTVPSGSTAGKSVIVCDTFGNRALLTERRCLPVVCHRKDAARFSEQQRRCLEEAAQGAVLVSACISPREREIINEIVNHGYPVITIHDNGFPDRYHPSEQRLDLCAEGRLLIVSPWVYQYRGKNEQVTVLFCKTMNCVVQALCRTRDDWWQ